MKKYPLLPGLLLFLAALFLSTFLYQDFGISWDEPVQRKMGFVSSDYIFKGDNFLEQYIERDHGVGFELPLVFLEQALNITDSREVYLMRHLATHIFFLLSCLAGYILAWRLWRNQWLACLAFILLAFHPRLYAHSYFNSKDIALLGMYTVSFLTLETAFRKKRWGWTMLAGAAIGYTTSIRILGIVMGAAVAAFLLIDIVRNYARKERPANSWWLFAAFLAGFCSTLYLAWPTLWKDPLNNFVEAYENMSHFRWTGSVFFRGASIPAVDLPWTYLPVWIGITTPIIWLGTGIAGILLTLFLFLRRPATYLTDSHKRNYALYLFCTLAPVAMVIVLRSVVYDDWRHVYFIYPSFVLLLLLFLHKLKKGVPRLAVSIALVVQILVTGWDLVRLHPFGQVYFNRLVSHKADHLRKNYELDYWGASYFQALEYLIANHPDYEIKVARGLEPQQQNVNMLQVQDRDRIRFVDEHEASYVITNFRAHPEDHPYPEIIYEIRRLNSPIIRIYKLR